MSVIPKVCDVRTLEHSAKLGAIGTGGLVSDQSSTRAFLDILVRFHREVITLELDHKAVLKPAPTSVL
jgi:hypothetical protein